MAAHGQAQLRELSGELAPAADMAEVRGKITHYDISSKNIIASFADVKLQRILNRSLLEITSLETRRTRR